VQAPPVRPTKTEYIVQVRKVRVRPGDGVGQVDPFSPALTYRYDSPLRVGDRVMCPGNEYSGPFLAEVAELGSTYDGYVKTLLCRVAPDRKRP